MPVRRKLVSLAATTLLLIVAVDLLAVDLLAPMICADRQETGASLDDDCFCCCTHIVFSGNPRIGPPQLLEDSPPDVPLSAVTIFPSSIYHPPKA